MGGGEGMRGALDMGSAPRDKLWIRPCLYACTQHEKKTNKFCMMIIIDVRKFFS